jgi:hypothetical protein
MNNFLSICALVVAAVALFVNVSASGLLGAVSTTQAVISAAGFNTAGTVTAGTATVTGDASVSGGTLDVVTANTATSTVKTGCVQTVATSTATPIKLTLGVRASTATTTFYGGTSQGIVYWEFGTCPSL